MVLTKRIEFDVFDENDFANFRIKKRVVDQLVQGLPVTGSQEFDGCPSRRSLGYSSQLCGYFSSSSATACSVSSSVCCVSNMTANSSVRVAFLLAMIVPGCGPCGMPRGCNVIEAGSMPRRDPKF